MTGGTDLLALLALQDVDSQVDRERHRRQHLPERAELADLERRGVQLRAERAPAVAARDEVAKLQEAAEAELKATEDRIAKVNGRLYGGTVTASRELQAMAADVQGLRERASELADRALELMEVREPLDAEVNRLDRELDAMSTRQAEVLERLARAEIEVDLQLERLRPERSTAAQVVPGALLATYERLRAKSGGIAVARLVGGRCDGCHLSIPAVELDRIRHEAPGTLEYCDQCGRILVLPG